MNLEFVEKKFNDYVDKFNKNNYDINYRLKHSYRVMNNSNDIVINLNLSDEDIYLANVIGLLHDIGRFKQIEMFSSYSDLNIDHADLGVKILFEDNLIEEFDIDKKYYNIIKFSIENHNKINIKNISDDRTLLHTKIIRDADKIDILNAFTIFRDYKLEECDDDISENVIHSFYNLKSIKYEDVKNPNDKIILTLSYIYDINFDYCFDLIKKFKIIEKIYESIINKDLFEPYFNHILNYLEER